MTAKYVLRAPLHSSGGKSASRTRFPSMSCLVASRTRSLDSLPSPNCAAGRTWTTALAVRGMRSPRDRA